MHLSCYARGVVGRGRGGTASPHFFDITKARLFTTQSSNVSSLCDARSDACKQQYHDLIRQFKVLEVTTWPSDVPCGFGEDEVTKLQKIQVAVRLNSRCIP